MEISKLISEKGMDQCLPKSDYQTYLAKPFSMDTLEQRAESTSSKSSCLQMILTPFKKIYQFLSWILCCWCCCPNRMSDEKILQKLKEMREIANEYEKFDAQSHFVDIFHSLPKRIQEELLKTAVTDTFDSDAVGKIDEDFVRTQAKKSLIDISCRPSDRILDKYITEFEKNISNTK